MLLLNLLPEDPFLLLYEILVGGSLSHVPLPLLLLLEGLHSTFLGRQVSLLGFLILIATGAVSVAVGSGEFAR